MATTDPHTVKAFDGDIEEIRALVAQMGGMAEFAIARSIDALITDDQATAAQVVASDAAIDRLSKEVERQCVRFLALRAPMADDLRETLAAFKQAIIIERMGDCGRSIAQQVPLVRGSTSRRSKALLKRMSLITQDLVRLALNCVMERDPNAACAASGNHDLLSSLHDELFRELLDGMADRPSSISASTCLLLASQKIVRLGEHSTNLVKVVHFAATGTPIGTGWIASGEERS